MSIILLYRCPSSSLVSFYSNIIGSNDSNITDVVLGEFKIDILNSTNISLQYVLSNYSLLVNGETLMSGSLIDHVYVNSEYDISCIC